MRIREAMESDLPAIVDIYNGSITDGKSSTNTQPTTVRRSTGWFRQHKATSKPILVAEDAGRIVGWLSVRPFYSREAYDRTGKVKIYVEPQSRGRGIGKELLDEAMSCGKSSGLNTLVCYMLADNELARRLFEDSGFDPWGQLPGVARLGTTDKDLIIMGRRL
jgi:phosphinothricin acetyltransferase